MKKTAAVTYFHNSGFSVQVGETLLIFDYWRGENNELSGGYQIRDRDFEGFKRILVFVSHSHEDPVAEVIYTWDYRTYPITYIVSDDLPADKRGMRVKAGDQFRLEDVAVQVFSSTDAGVSFYVTVDGVRIFHAGDLNLWHWREESTLREIAKAEKDFYTAMAPIEQLPMEIAMFPVDPRMGGLYEAGANYFVMSAKPRLFIPMHWQGRPEVAENFARKGRTKYTEVLALTKPRERAELEFEERELQIHVFTAVPDVDAPGEKADMPLDKFAGNDPFSETDLPVKL